MSSSVLAGEVAVPDHDDPREPARFLAGERVGLDHWLELYRQAALLKIAGLTGEQLAMRSVAPSSLSLVGIVRHLTEVETY